MENNEIIEQKVDFRGLIGSIDISPEEFLLPLQEIVVNAIQSIKDAERLFDGKIIINIIRKHDSILNFGTDQETAYNPIVGFTVRDNGIGFIKKRFKAFSTPYTDFGAEIHGCKGIGRYTVLACFHSMEIESYFEEEQRKFKRLLRFDNLHGLQRVADKNAEALPQKIYTEIKLNQYKDLYSKFIEKYQIGKTEIAEGIIQHCLLYFINESAPTIYLKEEKETVDEALILNDIYKSVISIEKTDRDVNVTNVQEGFVLNYIKNFNGVQSHSVHLCANNRQVGKKQTLTKYIPSFKELYDKDGSKYHLSLYVTSAFLDEKAHPQRNRFTIPEKDEKMNDFESISLDGLYRELAEQVRVNYSSHIDAAEKEKDERIKKYILNKDNPRLRYKHLLSIEDVFNEIPINASDATLESHLNEVSFKLEQKREKAFEKIFSKKKYDREEFGKIVTNVLREEASFSKDKLADLMVKRKSVLKLFKKYLEWRDDENFMLEEDLHNIIFTMGSDTENTPYEYHNLWLLDERLSFHSFTASDKQFRINKKLQSKSQKEPDILVYDIPCAYSDNPEKINSLVLFEFKRPGRNMETSTDKKLDSQLEEYFIELSKSKAKNSRGRFINIEKETPKFGYIVCDLHKDLIDFNIQWNGFKKTPHGTLYKVNSELNLHFEVIDYDHLIEFAEQRHAVFFKALGIDGL